MAEKFDGFAQSFRSHTDVTKFEDAATAERLAATEIEEGGSFNEGFWFFKIRAEQIDSAQAYAEAVERYGDFDADAPDQA
jgi:hypothetical protein